jgi:hypothetical protein
MSDLDKLKDKYDKKEDKASSNVKTTRALTKELEAKKDSAPVRAVKQAVSGFRSQWSGMDEKGNVGIGKGTPGIYYDTVAIPALAGVVDDKYAPEFAVEADKKAGRIKEAIRKDMGIEAPKGALEHFANAGGTMLAQLPVPGAWLGRVLSPVKSAGIAGKVATSPIEYLSPIVDPKKINYGVGTGFGGTIGTVGEMLEEEPAKKELGGLIQKYETGGRVGKAKAFFSAVDKAIDTLKQKKGTGEQILKEIEKAPGVKKEELELRKIGEKLKDKKSITQEEVRALAAESPAPKINTIVKQKGNVGVPRNWKPSINENAQAVLDEFGVSPVVNPEDRRMLGFMIEETGDIVDASLLRSMLPEDFGAEETNFRRLKDIVSSIQSDFNGTVNYLELGSGPKFEKYTTPGGENYREILLQMERPSSARAALGGDPVELTPAEAAEKIGIMPDDFAEDSKVLYYPSGYYIEKLRSGRYISVVENRDILSRDLSEVEDFLASGMSSELGANIPTFKGGHFDEPNVLVHARVTDRTGPNGEKVLYVEEIQSDWHQAARKERDKIIADEMSRKAVDIERQTIAELDRLGATENTRENRALKQSIYDDLYQKATEEFSKTVPKDISYSRPLADLGQMDAEELLTYNGNDLTSDQRSWLRNYLERWELDVDGTPAGQAAQEAMTKEYEDFINNNVTKGVPDAPFKSTANELAVKQILDLAANEGYDTVAFSPGSEHVKRYGMSQYMDTLTGKKDSSGLIELSGIKNDRQVVSKKGIKPEELADYVGKEKAQRILADLENSNEFMLRGQDLEMTTKEGAGKKKIYDEIIPNYVRKYAKKEFGAEPGEVDISLGKGSKTFEQYLDEINADPYRHFDEDEIFDELHERVMDKANVKGYDFKGEDADELWDQMMTREGPFEEIWHQAEQEMYQSKAKELADKDPGESIKAFSVPVTPQMREKITGEGQKLFAAAPVVGVQGIPGMEEAPQQATPEPEPEVEEQPMPFEGGGKVGKVKSAAKAALKKAKFTEKELEDLAYLIHDKGHLGKKGESIEALDRALKEFSSDAPALYRGAYSSEISGSKMKPGEKLKLSKYSSFSEDPAIARQFGDANVVVELPKGGRGFNYMQQQIENLMDLKQKDPAAFEAVDGDYLIESLKEEAEWIMGSPEVVIKGTRKEGPLTIIESDFIVPEQGPSEFETGGRVGAAKKAIEAAMKKAGQKKGQVAEKDLTTLQDFQTSLGDRINERVRDKMKLMDSFDYSFKPGDRVFTEWSAGNNYAPFEILSKTTTQKRFARDPNTSKILRDAEGNKVEIEPEPGYLVRHKINFKGEDIDHQYVIPQKNIKGLVEPDEPYKRGGPVELQDGGRVGTARAAAEKLMRVLHGSPSSVTPEAGRAIDVTTDSGYAVKRGADKMIGKAGPPMVSKFDIPSGRLLQFEEQYSPEDVALMKRYFNKLPQGQAMKGEEIWDAAQGRDVIMEGIAKAGGFAGYERPNTGAVGKGQWFRVTEPEELKRGKARGGLAQATKPL